MKVLKNFSQIATLADAYKKDGRHLIPEDLSIIENASLVFIDKEILWVGKNSDLPSEYQKLRFIDCTGKTLVPEIVDCHTHVVFGGNRAHEYSMRLNGADYEAIAKAGGGILNTMNGTNNKTRSELFDESIKKIETIHSFGVGTIEIKSGYGLNFDKEYEISHIINDLKKYFFPRIQIKNTFMAAHAIPKEFNTSKEYMDHVVLPLLEKLGAEHILDAVDIFFERGYFDKRDTISLFECAKKFNLSVKLHADEFQDNKGSILGCEYKALSADHLLMTGADGIETLAQSETVATLLPGTGFFLGKKQADAKKFLDAGCKVAIGSDYNPGSCHLNNVLLAASLAAPLYKMNIAELWCAITLNAAHALNLKKQGAIIKGLAPRFSIFDCKCIDEITYSWGKNLITPPLE
ncbi:MAG: imidazolonepropionase [Bdellovibrionales bacterium RIFOXYB1_FULL_37_110]|nr:MAG: imidazolonepropionase [Bdellovibrionales bacterium RIFOXYC1_FULL_37_79]OFZ60070.1 MAG: imidazolonepropionase [Bdellovibrionales bacterium RIFOXYB1_FULL_37_110]OFZ64934.1 MAG: imidazolonepropionase [Bdellovibrionales bacterium RIFOXYD1_FULL_36_51]